MKAIEELEQLASYINRIIESRELFKQLLAYHKEMASGNRRIESPQHHEKFIAGLEKLV